MFAICPRHSDDYNLLQLADELSRPFVDPRELRLLRNTSLSGLGESEVQNTDKEFRVSLALSHYKPEEVKITSDNERITIMAKHEEKQDKHGYVSREMTRIYTLPKDVDAKSVSQL